MRRLLGRLLGAATLFALPVGIWLTYRWAEPIPTPRTPLRTAGGGRVTVRLENAPFQGKVAGRTAWSVWAKRIDLERLPGAAFTSIQTATLTDIRNGVLYQLPDLAASGFVPSRPNPSGTDPSGPLHRSGNASPTLTRPSVPPVRSGTEGAASLPPSVPTATFHAQRGLYAVGNLEPIATDLALLYNVQWQFKLLGGVDFHTQAGDRLQSESLTILDMVNRRTFRPERRIVCEAGAQVTRKDVQVRANQARYDPAGHMVECLGGVRGTFPEGDVQAERLFWSLDEQILRCPDAATGIWHGTRFVATGLTIDLKRQQARANQIRLEMRIEERGAPRLP